MSRTTTPPASCLRRVVQSLIAVLGMGFYANTALAFEVLNSPLHQLARTKIHSWYVEVSDKHGAMVLSANSAKALLYHNALSVYSLAKNIQPGGVTLRYQHSKLARNYIGLLATTAMSIGEAKQRARKMNISPQSTRVFPEPRVVPFASVGHFPPNDTCYSYQDKFLGRTNHFRSSVEASYLWPGAQTSERAAIAILDSGIVEHEDFGIEKRILGADYISNANFANDGDGRDDDPTDPGFNRQCEESSGFHGTHVASIAAARGDNGKGIAGISWYSPIVALRVLGISDGAAGDVADAMRDLLRLFNHRVEQDFDNSTIRVANLSFGLVDSNSCANTFPEDENIATWLMNHNILTVTAAGNQHADSSDYAPANCPDMLNVLATNHQGGKAYYSNYGRNIDLAAPGGEENSSGNLNYGILALVNNNSYAYKQGTSMAAPIVTGIAAQLAGYEPNLSAHELRNILLATAIEYVNINSFGLKCDTSLCGSGIVSGKNSMEHLKSDLSYVFFPRQTLYLAENTTEELDVFMTRVRDVDIKFRLLVNAPGCTPVTYPDFIIPAGKLSADFAGASTLQLADAGCDNVSYTISLKDATGKALNPVSAKVLLVKDYDPSLGSSSITSTAPNTDPDYSASTRHLLRVIRKSEHNFEAGLELDKIKWEYLPAGKHNGNTHNIFLSSSGTFYLSTISDMNTEIIVKQTSNDKTLYDSVDKDKQDEKGADYWLEFKIDDPQELSITVKERFSGSGGLYAITLTSIPTFSTYGICPVNLEPSKCPITIVDKPEEEQQPLAGSAAVGKGFVFVLLLIAVLRPLRNRLSNQCSVRQRAG